MTSLNITENGKYKRYRDIVTYLRREAREPDESVLVGSDLLIDAADEIERLRGLIATWVDARNKWNKAMWNSDLTTGQRSLIEQELTRSINLLTVEAAWSRSVPQEFGKDSRRDLPA